METRELKKECKHHLMVCVTNLLCVIPRLNFNFDIGKVTNIPGSMVRDQFGIVGLLTFIRAAESDPNLVSLALGQDLTALGLNLNSPENIYPTFAGPWADAPCRPQDVEFHGPPEYIINHGIR